MTFENQSLLIYTSDYIDKLVAGIGPYIETVLATFIYGLCQQIIGTAEILHYA